MATIRPLERADLPAITRLARSHMEAFARDASFIEAMLADDPWAPEELPTLVATEEDGEIAGFIGAQARPMRFEGAELTGVNVWQFVVAPQQRGGGVATALLRRLLSGPQDLTWAEGAPAHVSRMWRLLGADVDHCRECDWMLVLRPGRWLRTVITRAPSSGLSTNTVPVAALAMRGLRPRALRRASGPSDDEVSGHAATAAEVVEQLPALSKRIRLRVDYDEQHLEHMIEQWGSLSGEIVCRLVRRRERAIGWYVYVPRRGAASRLLHLAALERETEAVVAELVADARARGSAVLAGRLEPHIAEALRGWSPAIGPGARPVVHARDAELRAALAGTRSLLTELDSIDSGWL